MLSVFKILLMQVGLSHPYEKFQFMTIHTLKKNNDNIDKKKHLSTKYTIRRMHRF